MLRGMRTSAYLATLVLITAAYSCGESRPAHLAQPAGTAAAQGTSPAPADRPPFAPTVTTARFASAALGVDKDYVVYLPSGYYSSAKRYPVIYMLHGLGGSETNWSKLHGLVDAANELDLEAIVIMPDGDDSFYVNWAGSADYDACLSSKRVFGTADDMTTYCVKTPRYRDYIVQDLVSHVDATYRTIADRSGRAIGGLSMGGYGALVTAMLNPGVYSVVVSHAGVDALTYREPHPYQGMNSVVMDGDPVEWLASAGSFGTLFEQVFGVDIAFWRARDPALVLPKMKNGELAIYLDVGTLDEFRLHDGAQYLHDLLAEAGIEHDFHLIDGGKHDNAFWTSRIDDSLAFVQRHLAAAQSQ